MCSSGHDSDEPSLTLRNGWSRMSADDLFWNGTDLGCQSHQNLLQQSEGPSCW
jgi:hypothetical protein